MTGQVPPSGPPFPPPGGDPAHRTPPPGDGPPGHGAGPVPSASGPAAPQADGQWHRLHPVTPLIRGWTAFAAIIFVIVMQNAGGVFNGGGPSLGLRLLFLGGIVAVVIVALGVWSWLSWRMTRYRVAEDAVHLHSGILFRQQRQARLDRLQAVDVVQPLLARLTGLAELKLEVAGGTGSEVRLAYLRQADAQRLRNTLLARAAGVRYESEEAPEAPEREVVAVPTDRLVLSLVRSSMTVALSLVLVVLVVVAVVGHYGVLLGAAPILIGVIGAHWTSFSGGFGFRVARSPDGIRLRHGLLETRSQTVPPGRVQAVRLSQPLMWRGPDWWRVQINVAGYGHDPANASSETTLLTVGTRSEALAVLGLVLPDLTRDLPWTVIEEGLTGTTGDGGYTCAPRRSAWVDPISWRRNGFLVTAPALLIRRGRLTRTLAVVPHERTQSLGLRQGPLQRRLAVASVVVHSTPGPVAPVAAHLDGPVAAALLHEQATRARRARSLAGPEQWMTDRDDADPTGALPPPSGSPHQAPPPPPSDPQHGAAPPPSDPQHGALPPPVGPQDGSPPTSVDPQHGALPPPVGPQDGSPPSPLEPQEGVLSPPVGPQDGSPPPSSDLPGGSLPPPAGPRYAAPEPGGSASPQDPPG